MIKIQQLAPNIDKKIQEWIERQRTRGFAKGLKPSKTICISRKYGCEAYPLAEVLKDLLEEKTKEIWSIWDKTLIELIARDKGIHEELLHSVADGNRQVDRIVAAFAPNWTTKSEAYEIIAQYIVKVARMGNSIIIGRGAEILTKDFPNCYHFRLEAPLEFRIKSIARMTDMTIDEASKVVIENQTKQERFLRSFLSVKAIDASHYHAVFNNERTDIYKIAKAIIGFLEIGEE